MEKTYESILMSTLSAHLQQSHKNVLEAVHAAVLNPVNVKGLRASCIVRFPVRNHFESPSTFCSEYSEFR